MRVSAFNKSVIARRPVGMIPRPSLRAREAGEAILRARDRLRNLSSEIASALFGMLPRNDRLRGFSFFLIAGLLLFSQPIFAATYAVDADHTSVSFKIRHLLSQTQGNFNQFEGSFDFDPEKPDTWKASMTVQAASIDTNVEPRDKHLRSADFFDAEKFPTLVFVSTGITDVTRESAKLNGVLTLHGVEKPATFDLKIYGVAKDPWGNTRASFTATTTINRKDFGLNWNKALETGQLLVGEEVVITLEVEGILQE